MDEIVLTRSVPSMHRDLCRFCGRNRIAVGRVNGELICGPCVATSGLETR